MERGVTQSVETSTVDRAGAFRRLALAGGLAVLAIALGLAVFPAGPGSRPRARPRDPNVKKLTDLLAQTIQARGIAAAVEQYRTLQQQGFPGLYESESSTNALGYKLLGQGDHASAIEVFRLNTSAHPESANVYDSLGEAYLAAGNTPLAIESYEKAVALNPKMKSAASELRRLTGRQTAAHRPIVLFHIATGTLGILSGLVAMFLRKGSKRHALVGSVFVVSMLCMSASGAYRAFVAPDGDAVNAVMGALTFYLVATAWLTARRRTGATGAVDWIALLFVVAVATGLIRVALTDPRFAAVAFAFGAVAVLAAISDVRMVVRGSVPTTGRLARHLWRMCTALYIGVSSLFLGQPQVFPYSVRSSGILVVPSALVALMLVFWLIRVRFAPYRRTSAPKPKPAYSARNASVGLIREA